jgi:hypothetical protein
VESGFPVPIAPAIWDYVMVKSLIVEAILISIVGFVESNAIAKTYARQHSYDISANRELVALGTANVLSVSLQHVDFSSLLTLFASRSLDRILHLVLFHALRLPTTLVQRHPSLDWWHLLWY